MVEIHGRSERGYLSRREDGRGSRVAVRHCKSAAPKTMKRAVRRRTPSSDSHESSQKVHMHLFEIERIDGMTTAMENRATV